VFNLLGFVDQADNAAFSYSGYTVVPVLNCHLLDRCDFDLLESAGIIVQATPHLWHALSLRNKKRLVMHLKAEDIEGQALSLPPEDRARLIERLIASFEPKSADQAAWMQLSQRRRDEVKSGLKYMVPGHEALERVRARIA
jgi:hypothetical protein